MEAADIHLPASTAIHLSPPLARNSHETAVNQASISRKFSTIWPKDKIWLQKQKP